MCASHSWMGIVTRKNGSNRSSRQTVLGQMILNTPCHIWCYISYSGTTLVLSTLQQFFAGNRVDGKHDSRIGIFSCLLKREA